MNQKQQYKTYTKAFKEEAVVFAANLPVQLVDGNELLSIIKDVHVEDAQGRASPEPVTPSKAPASLPFGLQSK
jgi:hypothetical protein